MRLRSRPLAAGAATSAALAADLAVLVQGPGLLPKGFQQIVMADQSSLEAGEAAEAAVGLVDYKRPDQCAVLSAYGQLLYLLVMASCGYQ